MNAPNPPWYNALFSDIQSRIDRVCALYPANQRRDVLISILQAFHEYASEADPSDAWLHLALNEANVSKRDISRAHANQSHALRAPHPSVGDAEDLIEDIARLTPPCANTALVAIRTAVLVAWTKFANHLEPSDRAMAAVEAVKLA